MDRAGELGAFDELLGPAGRDLLARLPPYEEREALALGARLRASAPASLVAAALTQARLRRRAEAKFGADAAVMFFTPAGLEQSTRAGVAALRARRFAALGVRRVIDLCAGIGGDAVALARAGMEVTAVEQDPLTAAVLAANADALGLAERLRIVVGDATAVDLGPYDGVFCDPARRTARGRVFDPRAYVPPWSFVSALLAGPRPAAVKLAPGIPHSLVPAGVEAQWVSDSGDVTEAVLWSGALSSGVPRRATLLPSGETLHDGSVAEPPACGAPRRYLYEPDGAVIRAGLVGPVATRLDGVLLDPTIAYVTSDALVRTPLANAYLVDRVLPFGLKALRAALREEGVGRVVVKKRGTAVEPDELRRRLRLDGGGREAIVVLTRVAGAQTALICRPA